MTLTFLNTTEHQHVNSIPLDVILLSVRDKKNSKTHTEKKRR